MASKGDPVTTVHRLKVSLRHISPPIWRRLELPSDAPLSQLNRAIQSAFGWENAHLHQFEVAGVSFSEPGMLEEGGARSERAARLNKVVPAAGMRLVYTYDFGDDWIHDIVVEAISPVEPTVQYPRCTAGARACPPEDCGGPWGYEDMLEALADPTHAERESYEEWLGREFDPETFDLAAANQRIRLWP